MLNLVDLFRSPRSLSSTLRSGSKDSRGKSQDKSTYKNVLVLGPRLCTMQALVSKIERNCNAEGVSYLGARKEIIRLFDVGRYGEGCCEIGAEGTAPPFSTAATICSNLPDHRCRSVVSSRSAACRRISELVCWPKWIS